MLNISPNFSKKYFISLFVLFIAFMLSACSNNLMSYFTQTPTYHINGNIYSHSYDIPENATITLSLTSIQQNENNAKSNLDYSFKTQSAGRSIAFTVALPEEFQSKRYTLGMSARVEKDGELIMMSNKLSPIPENLSEIVLLPVAAIQQ
ncbi:TPA: YbaY family lipoprotein [Providencia rettgeri]|uniref:YbaY family lipoprotein n=1 Tax=Providencia TaxID=586 RepID=UPI001B9DBCF1|nr:MULTISPECIES: YbaY family lipoprotein [Providencia]MDK7744943.1 YbaY family lipoprotein [Providencia rettgeri]MDK7757565.1 YbaY family lipoprotein [Providencia rettgeri]HBC7431091.1 YbaY family lipoprotein [Providencia rettgeri]